MKDLCVQFSDEQSRAFYAFDPIRQAIVLCAGDKSNDKRFYDGIIRIADDEFSMHLAKQEKESKK